MPPVTSAAAVEFDRTLREIGAQDLSPEAGRRAALSAAASVVWETHLGPLYTTREVTDLMSVTRQAVNERVKRGTLLALPQQNGDYLYPAFQFGEDGKQRRAVRDALSVFPRGVVDPHTLASWFVSPQGLLEGRTPADWVARRRPSEPLLEAARRSAALFQQ